MITGCEMKYLFVYSQKLNQSIYASCLKHIPIPMPEINNVQRQVNGVQGVSGFRVYLADQNVP